MATDIGLNNFLVSGGSYQEAGKEIIIARVTKVILNEINKEGKIDKDFLTSGGWGSIGSVKFNILYENSNPEGVNSNKLVAKPLFSNIKNYPLVGEIVLIVMGPSNRLNDSAGEKDYYYISQANLWNSQHHNAFPNLADYSKVVQEVSGDYTNAEAGETSQENADIPQFPLGETFKERSNIKPLLPFEGDFILEGRWGQSIRFGSTVTELPNVSPWSTSGVDGDPITILRNGQGTVDVKEGWVPVVESISTNDSSVYLTSTQVVPIDLSGFPLDTFKLGTKGILNSDNTLPLQDVPTSFSNIASKAQDEEILKNLKSNG